MLAFQYHFLFKQKIINSLSGVNVETQWHHNLFVEIMQRLLILININYVLLIMLKL